MTDGSVARTRALFEEDSVGAKLAQEVTDFHAQALERSETTRKRFPFELGLRYGDHPRQTLDVYRPSAESGPDEDRSVLAFLHGGGFRMGGTEDMAYVGEPLLELGALFISASYRLLPDAAFPENATDVEQMLEWVAANADELGCSPEKIYLGGMGAGSVIAAEVGLRPQAIPPDLVKGVVTASATLDYESLSEDMGNRASPRWTPSLAGAITHAPPHTILCVGADDQMPWCPPSNKAVADALRSLGESVEYLEVAGLDHFHAIDSLPDRGELFQSVRRMMALPE